MEDLENIRTKLIPFLPASIQTYNSVVLAMSDDDIERRVVSTPDPDQCSVVVLTRENQAGGVMISMFSSSDSDGDLGNLLEENIDWTEEIEFVVSLVNTLAAVLTDVTCRVSIRDIWHLWRVWLQMGPQDQVDGFMKP